MNLIFSRKTVLVATSVIFLLSSASGLIAADGHNPYKMAPKSDLIAHGAVMDVKASGEVEGYHPVTINVSEFFKGNKSEILNGNLSEGLKIQVKGTEKTYVSTAADFKAEEEVVVMLQKRENHYFMTNGYATKYEVQNNTIQLTAPEGKNITVNKMENIVENAKGLNQTDQGSKDSKASLKTGIMAAVIQFLKGLF